MTGSITVKDVAQKAVVSVGTVSRVFNNHSNVTEEIRQRVLLAAAELGYSRSINPESPNAAPRTLKEIGFLYCSNLDHGDANANPFWSSILNGVENEARKLHLKVTYRSIGELVYTPQLLATTIQGMKLGGILLVGPAEVEVIQLIKSLNIPLVLVDNHVPGLPVESVLGDNLEGARLATNYLISQGHRQIICLGGTTQPVYTIGLRRAGFSLSLLEAGLGATTQYIDSPSLNIDGGYEACLQLLKQGQSFSALFCVNDEIAIGAMKALREAGKRVPEEISVIGFDDIALVEHLTPALTTIRVNKKALGEVAVKSLVALSTETYSTYLAHVLDVQLIVRGSVIAHHG